MARSTHSCRRRSKETFGPLGIEPTGGSPEELKDFIAAEIAKWAPIVKAANIEF
jgi:tripartite-type tricarboxylate transporter receptor subunit TctC